MLSTVHKKSRKDSLSASHLNKDKDESNLSVPGAPRERSLQELQNEPLLDLCEGWHQYSFSLRPASDSGTTVDIFSNNCR